MNRVTFEDKTMTKIKFTFSAAVVAIAFNTSFAQAQTSDTEIGYMQKLAAMEAQCERLNKTVPCGVGSKPMDNLSVAREIANHDALVNLGVSIQAFVSYHSSDSSYANGELSKKLYSAKSIIEVKNLHLSNSRTVGTPEFGSFVNSEGNVRYYAIIVKTLDSPEPLYEEAKKIDSVAVVAAAAMPANASKATAAPQKNIAEKVARGAGNLVEKGIICILHRVGVL
jgi:hypothetical protein